VLADVLAAGTVEDAVSAEVTEAGVVEPEAGLVVSLPPVVVVVATAFPAADEEAAEVGAAVDAQETAVGRPVTPEALQNVKAKFVADN